MQFTILESIYSQREKEYFLIPLTPSHSASQFWRLRRSIYSPGGVSKALCAPLISAVHAGVRFFQSALWLEVVARWPVQASRCGSPADVGTGTPLPPTRHRNEPTLLPDSQPRLHDTLKRRFHPSNATHAKYATNVRKVGYVTKARESRNN